MQVGFNNLNQDSCYELTKALQNYGIIPELLGRLPVIARLSKLTINELVSVLTVPKKALINQYVSLFKSDEVALEFTPEAITEIATCAYNEGLGARALKKILEDMTGLNATADQHIERRNTLRKELENLQDKENALIKERLPLENELKQLQKELNDAQEMLETLEENRKNFGENQSLKQEMVDQLAKELGDFRIIQQNALHDLDITKNEINDSIIKKDTNIKYRNSNLTKNIIRGRYK